MEENEEMEENGENSMKSQNESENNNENTNNINNSNSLVKSKKRKISDVYESIRHNFLLPPFGYLKPTNHKSLFSHPPKKICLADLFVYLENEHQSKKSKRLTTLYFKLGTKYFAKK
eukprot:c1574_g1_i2.p1 GENE.c1574_g1_i2~~c1574_g1_i2.p1  ORF type:complete len:131 (+),score=50.56 c1574_g1_i2:44-394(+)